MNLLGRTLYNSFVFSIKAYQRLFMDMYVWGRRNIPKGPKIYITNHVTALDVMVTSVFTEPVHIVVGPAYKTPIMAKLLDLCEQINAMPDHRRTVVADAVKYLKRGEPVYINPEGDFCEPFQMGRFYPGVARIYRQARVPIVPIALLAPKSRLREYPFKVEVDGRVYRTVVTLRGPYCINIGEPMMPTVPDGTDKEQDECVLAALKERLEFLVEDARVNRFWQ